MDEVVFRVAQRKTLLIWSTGALALALIAVLVALAGRPSKLGIAIVVGMIGLLVAPLTLNLAAGKTVLTSDGLVTGSLSRRRSCRWEQVTEIATKDVSGRNGGTDTWIVIHRTGGRSFKLLAPFDSTNGRDPRFQESLAVVRSFRARPPSDASTERAAGEV